MKPMVGEASWTFGVIGVNFRTAPLALREKLAIPKERLTEVIRERSAALDLPELVVLSTCNRFEWYFATPSIRWSEAVVAVTRWIQEQSSPAAFPAGTLYSHEGPEAFKHLARVGAGLDSLVVGEAQIFGQLKEAYRAAELAGTAGRPLKKIFSKSFSIVKRIRSETEIGRGSVSVASVAVELAEKMFGTLEGRRVALLGSGKIGELTARALALKGVTQVTVVNRTLEKAQELAGKQGGTARPWAELKEVLAETDVVIVSTGAPHYVVEPAHLELRRARHRGAPIFFIDLSLPRNVDPALHRGPGTFVYSIEDLEGVARANADQRQVEARRAEELAESLTRVLPGWGILENRDLDHAGWTPAMARMTA